MEKKDFKVVPIMAKTDLKFKVMQLVAGEWCNMGEPRYLNYISWTEPYYFGSKQDAETYINDIIYVNNYEEQR